MAFYTLKTASTRAPFSSRRFPFQLNTQWCCPSVLRFAPPPLRWNQFVSPSFPAMMQIPCRPWSIMGGDKITLGDQQHRMNASNQQNNTRLWEVLAQPMRITIWTATVWVSLSKPSSPLNASPWVVEWGRLFSVAVCSQTELSARGLALACGKHTYWGKPRWRIEIRIYLDF